MHAADDPGAAQHEHEHELGVESLSADTLAALRSFLTAKADTEREEEAAEAAAAEAAASGSSTVMPAPLFGMSQFWYTDATAEAVAKEVQ